MREAQASKSRTQDLAGWAALWLTVVALAGGALTLLAWLALAGREFSFALERAVTVMVIACPHALGLAIPLVVAVSTAQSARRADIVLVRSNPLDVAEGHLLSMNSGRLNLPPGAAAGPPAR